jgi:hypothetical protein
VITMVDTTAQAEEVTVMEGGIIDGAHRAAHDRA